jgi:hypothetical protein
LEHSIRVETWSWLKDQVFLLRKENKNKDANALYYEFNLIPGELHQ